MKKLKKELSEPRWWMFPFLLISAIPLSIIDQFSKNTWFCDFWGWHKAPTQQGFDGASFNGKCPRCGRKVLQDSQGNWFDI